MITAWPEAPDVQPSEFVTVNVYVAGDRSETVIVVPLLWMVLPPGVIVNTQDPDEGSPLRSTIPVRTSHVGCVIVPITGAPGAAGGLLKVTSAEFPEVQPPEFVTVQWYVPGARPETVTAAPVPVLSTAPGYRVRVQVPLPGNPLSTTLPVGVSQVGWVTVPVMGGEGV